MSTNVTLNVVDAGATAWANGTYVATLGFPPGGAGPFYLLGVLMTPNQLTVSGNLNASGSATFALSSNTDITPVGTTWSFNVGYNQPTNPAYFKSGTLVTGVSQTVNLTPPAALPIGSGGTYAIASGAVALGTSSIASGAKSSTITIPAPGVLATDNVQADFNSDPTAVTGYIPGNMLTIVKFCSANAVNFIQVNNTGGSLTPSPITLNWRVQR